MQLEAFFGEGVQSAHQTAEQVYDAEEQGSPGGREGGLRGPSPRVCGAAAGRSQSDVGTRAM